MFYLIEIEYLGPNRESKGRHAHKIRVQKEPGRKNMSLEPCEKGWLGTTDNWDKWALGKFTQEEAYDLFRIKGLDVDPSQITYGNEFYI